ncbi:PH domain-containing protein [Luteococcus peritonei]|uniref:PH domain-containing protein n=1 Tax=Luteococcus peritonei TaxID=88874 RepID=A0ABW4RWR7_9ACTN
MARVERLLGTDEDLVRQMHTHAKALVGPVMLLLLCAIGLGAGLAVMPAGWQPWGGWVLAALLALVVLVGVLVPVLRWRANTYILTTRRIIHRAGILRRTSHDLPLGRINDVASERGLVDRLFGCGTLKLTTAAEDPVLLHDVPDVERVHLMLSELLFGDPSGLLDQRDERRD